jgi:PAS domain S-box-containing protein
LPNEADRTSDESAVLTEALGPGWITAAHRALVSADPVRFAVRANAGESHEVQLQADSERGPGRLSLSLHTAASLRQAKEPGSEQDGTPDDLYLSLFDAIDSGFCLMSPVREADGRLQDLRFVVVNRAFRSVTGFTGDSPVGLTLRDILPAVEDQWIDQAEQAFTTGEPSTYEGFVAAVGRWFEVRTVPHASSRVAMLLTDVTDRRQSDVSLRQSEERQRFLLELSDQLRPLADPAEVMQVAARMLAHRLGVSAIGYAVVGEDGDTIRAGGEYGDGRMPSLEGFSSRLSDFGSGLGPALHRGESIFTGDIRDAENWKPGGSDAARDRNLGAAAMIPLLRGDRLIAYLYAVDPVPRTWSEEDRTLLREVADRTWSAFEMAHTQAMLRASEERFRTLIQHSADAIQLVSTDGLILYSSDSIVTVLGYRPDEIEGHDIRPYLHPDDAPGVGAWIEGIASRPDGFGTHEYRVRHRDGHWVWLETSIANHLETPTIRALVGNFRNITERRRIDEALRSGEERYQALFESMDQGFCTIEMIFDADGHPIDYRFLEINPAFERNTGLIDAVGRRMRELIPNHEQRWFDVYGEVALTGEAIRFEQEAAALDRWLSLYAYRIGQPEQRRVAVLFEDITARKRSEEEREQARQVAERAVVARDRFLSIGAHELRTPITGIKGSAELLLRAIRRGNPDPARLERYAGNLLESTDRMATLVDDLFDVARLQSSETAQLGARMQPTDLAELVRTTLRSPHLDRSRNRLSIALEPTARPVEIDPDRIRQVLVNLIDNALKYSPEGGQIRVTLTQDDCGATLRVQDTGIGLPAEDVETIFEPFNRAANAAASSIPGMGLGLYICREIVRAHGGRLWAESDGEGSGTTMTLWLPATVSPGEG